MRFCPQCGTPVIAGAKFCVECGTPLGAPAAGATSPAGVANAPGISPTAGAPGATVGSRPADVPGAAAEAGQGAADAAAAAAAADAAAASAAPWRAAPNASAPPRVNRAFAVAFGGILIVGLGAAALILRKLPQRQQEVATAAIRSTAPGVLPPGHPQLVKLPDEARKFITNLQSKAEAAPKDVAAWNRLGDVTERAAMFDQSYYAVAERAYAHVLKLDPDNLDALRGVGNLDYDRHRYDEAIAAYEHYLNRKPDDPRVRTDLGTMYLSSGNTDLAMVEYKKVVAKNPKFFEAYFNLGVAYAEQEDKPAARSYFLKARELAPDDRTRGEIDQMLATVGGAGGGETAVASGESGAGAGGAIASSGAGGATGPAIGGGSGTFQNAFEQMVRALPIAGSKVHAVQWTGNSRARMLMDDFPMDQMPPFAATRFLEDLKSGTRDVMNDHHVQGPMTVEIADAASNRVMQSVTVDGSAAAPGTSGASAPGAAASGAASGVAAASSPPGASAAPDGVSASDAASAPGALSSETFQDAVASMMRNLPVAGPKVAAVQWPSKTRAKVMMDDFPMDAMPPFARDKFIADIKAGLQTAKTAHKVTGTVTVDIDDAQSGRVMESVSQ
jgi:tetratricopeptide (TPR) repeat protein